MAAGTYAVTATDANGCTLSQSTTIGQPASAVGVAITASSNVTINGGSDGTATAMSSGGTPTYTMVWSNGDTGPNADSLSAGIYTVTTTDANGCTATTTVVITEPTPLNIETTHTDILCNGDSTGTASVTSVTGGVSPYTYLWNTGATTSTISNLVAGTYTVTVTDMNGATAVGMETVLQPHTAVSATAVVVNENCFGGSNGSIDLTPAGGTPGYTYAWNTGATTQDLIAIPGGTYTVIITDANGCSVIHTETLTEPDPFVVSETHVNILCNGDATGSIDLTVNGGTTPYIFAWSNGITTQNLSNLTAGPYTVFVSDASLATGCTAQLTVNITEPTAVNVNAVPTAVLCFGGQTGSAVASASGGTPGYTYMWNTGATTANISNLVAGTYTVTATDANGCTDITTTVVTQPNKLGAWLSRKNVTCYNGNDGTLSLSPFGGTSPYTYLWNDGVTTEDRSGLTAGKYIVTITDANGCKLVKVKRITMPPRIRVNKVVTKVTCFGGNDGAIDITVNGGTPGYTYLWNDGTTTEDRTGLVKGKYIVTITDSKGCKKIYSAWVLQPARLRCNIVNSVDVTCAGGNDGSATVSAAGGTKPYTYVWTNGQTTATATGLSAGTYTVTIKDQNGATSACIKTCSVTITEPAPLTCTIQKTGDVNCFGGNGGSATVSASGGTAPYTYMWSSGQTDAALVNVLTAGIYTVTVYDVNQCQSTCTVEILQPLELTCSITSSTNVTCAGVNDGSATVTAAGGQLPYSYAWSNGQTMATASGLTAGTYTVVVTDNSPLSSACFTVCTVTITEPDTLTCEITAQTNVTCAGGNDGSATVTAAGGTGAYTYAWTNGQTTATATGLAAGTYTVTVKDQNGATSACITTCSVTITEPDTLTCEITAQTNVTCAGGNDGSATVTAAGGTGAYTYAWTNGQTTATATGLAAGTYTVTVKDQNGATSACITTCSVTITEPDTLTCEITAQTNVTCAGGNDGSATVTAAGGTGAYTYAWNNGQTTATATGLAAGTYTVTVKDQNGATSACITTCSVTITEPDPVVITLNPVNISCLGILDGAIDASVTGGTGAYSYSWSSGESVEDLAGLDVGTYTLIVTDANGCADTASVTLTADNLGCSCVGDFVWEDQNGNGIQDPGEPGYPGMIVSVYTCDTTGTFPTPGTGTPAGTDTTDLNGEYLICDLPAGNYYVVFGNAPAGFAYSPADMGGNDSLDSDAMSNGATICFNLPPGDSCLTKDLGLIELASIGDFVWDDINENGVQDPNEPGIAGVTVYLQDCNGVVLDSAVTDSTGFYAFTELVPGDYKLTFDATTLPAGYIFTGQDLGGNDNFDSDVDANTGMTTCTSLSAGENDPSWDAGAYIEKASIGDFVWDDINEDGVQDPNEPGIAGVTVYLQDCNGVVLDSAVTDSTGFYAFTELVPGDYKLTFDATTLPAGYIFTGQDLGGDDTADSDVDVNTGMTTCTTLAPGENDLTWDAGAYIEKASIGDFVWDDINEDGVQDPNEPGIAGVTVYLQDCNGVVLDSAVTDSTGFYAFTELVPGDYKLTFDATTLPAGYIFTGQDLGGDDTADSDVDVNTGMTTCTTLAPGENDLTWDAGAYIEKASIGDFVWNDLNMDGIQDANEPGVPGIIVYLYDSAGVLVATDTTDANGFYSFEDLVPGDYQVCVEPTSLPFGYTFSPMDATADSLDSDVDATGCMMTTTLDPGENDLTWDAGIFEQEGCIGDFVWEDLDGDGIQDPGEPGYEGLVVSVYTCDTVGSLPTPGTGTLVGTDTTDANGAYLICGLVSGDYYVVFDNAPTGFMYTMPNAGTNDSLDSDAMMNGGTMCINLPPGDTIPTIDLGLTPLASIGDFVWNDLNMDGIQDSNEVGVPGISCLFTGLSR